MEIPFIDLQKQYQNLKAEILPAVERVFAEGAFIMGEYVRNFEAKVSDYLGQPAIGCASGSDALLLALMATGLKPGDEVITTSFTFFATAGAIARLGATPVFADIDPDTFNISPDKISAAITPKTKAIIVVHLFGQCADLDKIGAIAKSNNLKVIEDACQSFGARLKGKQAGTIGDFGCYSFFPTKNLGGAGDGGLVTAKNPADLEILKILRLHGAKIKYYNELVGINSRLDALQAVILDIKLAYIDKWNGARQKIAGDYSRALAGVVAAPKVLAGAEPVYHQYAILTPQRDALLKHLQSKGIAAGVYYPSPLHLQPCFSNLNYAPGSMPVTERVCGEILSLPIFPEMTAEQVQYVIEAVRTFYE